VKLLKGNGRVLEVWDVGEPIMRLYAGSVPIKCPGWRLLEDNEARELVRALIEVGARGEKLR
jgi:hypothetical protein